MPPPDVAEASDRLRALETRARSLARSGDFEAEQLAGKVLKLVERIAEAAEKDSARALLEAGRALTGEAGREGKQYGVVRLAQVVAKARAGVQDLVERAPTADERRRAEQIAEVYGELDDCCRELANAFIANNMARRKLLVGKVQRTAEKAKEGVAQAKAPATQVPAK